MAAVAAVQGASLMSKVWTRIEAAVYAAGGTDEHLALLSKDLSKPVFQKLGAEIVRTIFTSFHDLVRAGNYGTTVFFPYDPKEFHGQTFAPVARPTKPCYPGVRLTTTQVIQRYGARMASLSDLLHYGISNPEAQIQVPIAIAWAHKNQAYYAVLDRVGTRRFVAAEDDLERFSSDCSYLLLQPVKS